MTQNNVEFNNNEKPIFVLSFCPLGIFGFMIKWFVLFHLTFYFDLISIPLVIIRLYIDAHVHFNLRSRRGHDRMVVEFTTTYAISVYHP